VWRSEGAAFARIGRAARPSSQTDASGGDVQEVRFDGKVDDLGRNGGPRGEQGGGEDRTGQGHRAGDPASPFEAVQERADRGRHEVVGRPGVVGVAEGLGAFWSWAGRPTGRVACSRLPYTDAATLPMTATPSAAPNRRVASLTAEPTPALSVGTTPRIASVAGAVMSPSPPPPTIICAAMTR